MNELDEELFTIIGRILKLYENYGNSDRVDESQRRKAFNAQKAVDAYTAYAGREDPDPVQLYKLRLAAKRSVNKLSYHNTRAQSRLDTLTRRHKENPDALIEREKTAVKKLTSRATTLKTKPTSELKISKISKSVIDNKKSNGHNVISANDFIRPVNRRQSAALDKQVKDTWRTHRTKLLP